MARLFPASHVSGRNSALYGQSYQVQPGDALDVRLEAADGGSTAEHRARCDEVLNAYVEVCGRESVEH